MDEDFRTNYLSQKVTAFGSEHTSLNCSKSMDYNNDGSDNDGKEFDDGR